MSSDASHMSGGKPIVPAPPEEQRYTLKEAQAHLAAMECVQFGHSFSWVTTAASPDPVQIFCDKCGKSWGIAHD